MPVSRRHVVLGLAVALAGCGKVRQSKLNPFNWFRKSEPRETIVLPGKQEDPRPLVDTVLSMQVEPIPGGAVVRARGVTPTQGWWDAELVPQPVDENGRLVLEFRIFPPLERTAQGVPQSREVVVALYQSNIKLDPVREIIVQGETNARAARR